MDQVFQSQTQQYGADYLRQIKDYGVLRCMMDEDPWFFELIQNPFIDFVLERTTGSTSILHLQNGIVVMPNEPHWQARYHQDFNKNFVSDPMISINIFFMIDDFTTDNGATWVLPKSQRQMTEPTQDQKNKEAFQLEAQAGSVFVFDSLLWHSAGENRSDGIRRGINHQFTRPIIKQQIDYPRLFEGRLDLESPLAQRMGFWTRPPRSTKEYRVADPALRTYRPGQG